MIQTENRQLTRKRFLSLILAFSLSVTMLIPAKAIDDSQMKEQLLARISALIAEANNISLNNYPIVYATQVTHALRKAEEVRINTASTHEQLHVVCLELQIALDMLVIDLQKATIFELQNLIKSGKLSYKKLTQMYLDRIELYDVNTIKLNSIRIINPQALADAEKCDRAFAANPNVAKGMFGMPILIKDNVNVIGMPDRKSVV